MLKKDQTKLEYARSFLFSWLGLGAIFCLIIFGSFYLSRTFLHTNVPFVVAKGISMRPTINEGDIIIFKGEEPSRIKIGDVIIFEIPDELVGILPPRITHRVVDIKTTEDSLFFRTKGDNAPLDSFEVPEDKILGKKMVIIPYLGLVILLAKKPLGIAVLVIGFSIFSISGRISKKNNA